jgi:glycosyltransferase involved in cell wall biosynthesis
MAAEAAVSASAPRVPRSLSVVVPVYNEEANAQPLVEQICAAVAPLGIPFELVAVDDGSRDETLARLRALVPRHPQLVVVALRRNFGQTLALQAGLDRARGDVIVTMDGDLQNDPRDIPALLERIAQGADVVSGWRRQRQDTLVLRKIPSWIANRMVRAITGVSIHDQGCSLKAYRSQVIHALDLYGDMHRFIAVLTMPLGARIAEVEVNHRARSAGTSKYGISRTFKVIVDLCALQMLTRFRARPLRWFALIASPFLMGALGALILWPFASDGSVVYPATATLLGGTFASCVMFGLLSELILERAGESAVPRVVYREEGSRSRV